MREVPVCDNNKTEVVMALLAITNAITITAVAITITVQ